MSDNRRNCLETLKQSGLTVILISPDNISRFILPEAPLHEGFAYLSETHKADYLRAYLMHFYGGGYSDIKNTTGSWVNAWTELENNHSALANGIPEEHPWDVARVPDVHLNENMQRHWKELIRTSAYIFRPRTAFTEEWYKNMMLIMDSKLSLLKQYPSRSPQERYSREYPYPLTWNELLGQVFHPLCYKYRNNLLHSVPAYNLSSPYR